MNSLKKKFGKFAVSTEKLAKVKGGIMAVCTQNSDGSGTDWLIAAENMDDLQALADTDGGYCTAV